MVAPFTGQDGHGVSFEAAALVFLDSRSLDGIDDREDYDEERYIITGLAAERLLTVIYCERAETIRIISARRASRSERLAYDRFQTDR